MAKCKSCGLPRGEWTESAFDTTKCLAVTGYDSDVIDCRNRTIVRLRRENSALRACVEAADGLHLDTSTPNRYHMAELFRAARAEPAKLEKA